MTRLAQVALICCAWICVGVTPVFAQIVDGPKVSWNLSVWGKKRAMTAGIEYVAQEIAKRTNGRFKIKIRYGEALSKSRENLDGISLGAFQAAFICNFYHPGKNPAWMVLTLPFLPLGDLRVAQRVREIMLQHPAFLADMKQWNAIPYISAVLPAYQFMGKGKRPEKLSDWNGLRVRAGGGIGLAMAKLGATRSTVPSSDIYMSLDRGTLDAVSLPFTYAFGAFQVDTVADWYTSNLSPGTTECAVVLNEPAYNKLPQQYRELLQEVKAKAYEVQLATYRKIDAKNVPRFRKKLTEIDYSDDVLRRFREQAGQPVWDDWVANNKEKFDSTRLLNDLLAAIETAKADVQKK